MLEKTFGNKKNGIVYNDRVGAYGIGFNGKGKTAVVRTPLYNGQTGYFLLGGGIEKNENHAECIMRECLEEAGLSVTPKDFVCKGDFYYYIEETQTNLHGTGYFYYMLVNEIVAEQTELDHSLVWLSIDEIREKLFLPSQIWAVEQVYKLYLKQE